ncbi:MAG TPA: penicillin acylase family protein [Solirubrobacteraceae bacterium]|nr:penicillin acylase family protein [Solirubrobacteraceae bacterium]
MRTRGVVVAAAAALCMLLPAAASAQPTPYGTDNYGYFNDILPPGANGLDTLPQALSFETTKAYPPHSMDQLQMYSSLTTAAPNIQPSQIGRYYKSSIFGVPAGDVIKTETPEPGVTIEWDNYGVPHIYGDTRPELMFGIGWATAEDRLFLIDVLRHYGAGDLASFAGGANVATDEQVWQSEPYTQADRVAQVNYIRYDLPGGAQVYADAADYVAGINAYITEMQNPLNTAAMEPAEYTLLHITPQPFTVEDLVSIATLVGGIFGNGGGRQLSNAILYEQMLAKFGREHANVPGSPQLVRPAAHRGPGRHAARVDHSGFATFMSFDDPKDPSAPTTVHDRRFPYQQLPMPSRQVRRTIALPDPGSVQYPSEVTGGALPHRVSSSMLTAGIASAASHGLFAFPRAMSNALLVSARHSTTGHPIAVMGPQVGYFAPQILMEEDIHGPGIDSAGAAFPGVNLYVELGHGPDYAWSATSAGQNIIDTFAVPLCNPSGGAVSTSSDFYRYHGSCVAMQALTDSESWKPNLADSTPAGSATFTTYRTAYGLVTARATVHGRPVAYTNLRSTYFHELDSALGFAAFNTPAQIRSPQQFFHAANQIGYTFNWFYADNKHIGYFNSGLNPVRAPHTDPLFPSWASSAWAGYRGTPQLSPQTLVERDTPQSAHPQVVDQAYLTSWNNKQAPAYNDAATGQQYSSVWRSQLLDAQIKHYLRLGHGKMSLTNLINAMGSAGTQDLRGVAILPYALKIIGRVPRSSPIATAVAELATWVATGAHRINTANPGPHGTYQQGAAVQLMDAWYPLLVNAEFGRVLGAKLLATVESDYSTDNSPIVSGHLGSAFDVGFYGIVQEDLRSVLAGHVVTGGLHRIFCGAGSRAACRHALIQTLARAASESAAQVYPASGPCTTAGDQMCADAIQFRAIGTISMPLIEWVNRPTFQQADMIYGHSK